MKTIFQIEQPKQQSVNSSTETLQIKTNQSFRETSFQNERKNKKHSTQQSFSTEKVNLSNSYRKGAKRKTQPDDLFRRMSFVQQKNDDQMFKFFIEALQKKPQDRKKKHLEFIKQKAQEFVFFKDLIEKQGMLDIEFSNLCRYIEYEFIPTGHNVFNYGQIGDKFYMLLKGRVGIIVPLKSQISDIPIS